MRYVSIDLETTGLDPTQDQVLQVALVIEDTSKPEVPVEQLPYFECLVSYPEYRGSAFALALNAEILSALAAPPLAPPYVKEPVEGHRTTLRGREIQVFGSAFCAMLPWWESEALTFLELYLGTGKLNVAGKNAAGFDLRFLRQLHKRFRHRVIDPGSVFFDDSLECLSFLDELKQRLGLVGAVSHDALDDARDVIRVLRKSYTQGAKL